MIYLGQAAKFIRTRLGLSQRAAATELHISFVQINNIENAKSKPSAATLEKYRETWGIDLYMVAVTMFSDDSDVPAPLERPLRDLEAAWHKQIEIVIARRKNGS